MRRWTLRALWAMALGAAMPALASAQPEPVPNKVKVDDPRKIPAPMVVNDPCPYRAATSYNATVVGRPVPYPGLNMPSFVLCCDIPNMNTDTYVAPPCNWGCGGCGRNGGGCGGGCNSGCTNVSLFGSNRGGGCGNGGCNSGCNSCDRGHRNWQRFSCGTSCGGGCNSGCNSGCGSSLPAVIPPAPNAPASNLKPVSYLETDSNIELVGWFVKSSNPNNPVNDCMSCPGTGPKQKCSIASPTALSCAGCSTWEHEHVFIFGTCRQFFGEPTHKWLAGK